MASDTVDLEYIGDPPILDEVTKFKISTGEISDAGANVLRTAEECRLKAIPGVTYRMVDKESFGTSRDYKFGPNVFVVSVDRRDAHKIMDSESGDQFRLVGTGDLIIVRDAEIAIASEWDISKYDVYQRPR